MQPRGPTAIPVPADEIGDVLRPFIWIGALAFVTGFWGYLIVAPLVGG